MIDKGEITKSAYYRKTKNIWRTINGKLGIGERLYFLNFLISHEDNPKARQAITGFILDEITRSTQLTESKITIEESIHLLEFLASQKKWKREANEALTNINPMITNSRRKKNKHPLDWGTMYKQVHNSRKYCLGQQMAKDKKDKPKIKPINKDEEELVSASKNFCRKSLKNNSTILHILNTPISVGSPGIFGADSIYNQRLYYPPNGHYHGYSSENITLPFRRI
jgi:hypothetical protein